MKARTAAGAAVLAAALALAGLVVASRDTPPLRVRPARDGVVIDVQTLGEYQTTVHRIRVTCGGVVVWEVMAAADARAQLHAFTLRAGENPRHPDEHVGPPEYRAVVPADGEVFRLPRGERCRIEAWGSESRFSRAAEWFTL